jgi:hypothetical protein
MGCKYVKDFDFSTAGKTQGQAYARGGRAHKAYAMGGKVESSVADLKQDKKMIAEAVHKHERNDHPGKPLTKLKKGGMVVEKATGERYPSREAMVKHEAMETPRMQKEEMVQKRVVRGPAMAAGRDPRAPMLPPTASSVAPPAFAKGGKFDAKMGKVMGEFGKEKLHSGSKKGPEVTNPKQAIAIAYSEARKATKK